MKISAADVAQLKNLVKTFEESPELLHDPKIGFFRTWLESLGARIPPPPKKEEDTDEEMPDLEETPAKQAESAPKEPEPEPMEEEEPEEKDPDVIEGDVVDEAELKLVIPDEEAELSVEDEDKVAALEEKAQQALEEENPAAALSFYTQALKVSVTAPLINTRAALLLNQKRPNAAIFDATQALAMNPNSAKAYRVRGRAHRLLGEWDQAFKDLSAAQNCDFNEQVRNEIKEIEAKAAKGRAKEAKKRKQAEDAATKRAREAAAARAKAHEEAKRRAPRHDEDEDFEMPGGMPNIPPELMQKLMSDPAIMAVLNRPGVMQKVMQPENMAQLNAIRSDPSKINQISDPDLRELAQRLVGVFGGDDEHGGHGHAHGPGGHGHGHGGHTFSSAAEQVD